MSRKSNEALAQAFEQACSDGKITEFPYSLLTGYITLLALRCQCSVARFDQKAASSFVGGLVREQDFVNAIHAMQANKFLYLFNGNVYCPTKTLLSAVHTELIRVRDNG
jgi:hypothetical protein